MEDKTRHSNITGEQPLGEWAASRARGYAGELQKGAGELQKGAEEAAGYVQSAVSQTREYVEGAMGQAKDVAKDVMEQARDKMTEYREGGFEKVRDDVAGFTRQQPVAALLMAAGAGLLIGLLTAGSRR